MKKISLKEIAREIRASEFAPKKWEFDTIEQVGETKTTSFGKMTEYIVTIKFNAARYDDNGIQFQVNHYEDEDSYSIFYEGAVYLG